VKKRVFLFALLALSVSAAFAQDTTLTPDTDDQTNDPLVPTPGAIIIQPETTTEATSETTEAADNALAETAEATPELPSETAQPVTATAGALSQPTAIPTATVTPDTRIDTCTAAQRPDFSPYIIRAGDTLATLLAGQDEYNVTQIALINCIEDPNSLPVGGLIFLPNTVPVDESFVYPDDADPTVSEAEIADFSSSETTVLNQEGTTLRWDAIGSQAYVYVCPPAEEATCRRPALMLPLPPIYELTIQDFPYAGTYRYRLEVVDGEATATADVTFEVACSQVSLGATTGAYQRCPQEPPLAVYAAWQPFENGVMLYFSDTDEIYVLYNGSQRVQIFPNTWEEGDDNPKDDAPDDRLTPSRGFGNVWAQLGGAENSGLGWARAEEIGFDSARQSAGRDSFTTYIQGPGETVYAVTFVPTLSSANGFWSQVAG
jgi:hypothetical protein